MSPTNPTSPVTYRVDGRELSVRLTAPGSADVEAELASRGVAVPIDQRLEWCRVWGVEGPRLDVRDADGWLATFQVEEGSTRALPGFRLWRIDRFGGFDDPDALEAGLAALVELAVAERRVVEVTLGISSEVDELRHRLTERARAIGYARSREPRGYTLTRAIDLNVPLEEIERGMSQSWRRHVRATRRHPVSVRALVEPTRGPRLDELLEETMQRTSGPGGKVHPWDRVIRFAKENPDDARLVGMFEDGTDRMLAYALGLRQGNHVEYRSAASTRVDTKVPMAYALAWDLIVWAKERGARWFDFGGVPADDGGDHSAVAGITRFKKGFGGETIEFREEWTYDVRPVLSGARHALSSAARGVRRLAGGG